MSRYDTTESDNQLLIDLPCYRSAIRSQKHHERDAQIIAALRCLSSVIDSSNCNGCRYQIVEKYLGHEITSCNVGRIGHDEEAREITEAEASGAVDEADIDWDKLDKMLL